MTNMKFSECLQFLLSFLDISISRLSKAINVDSSLVSRWINEKRTPSYKNTTYIESISEYLSKCVQNSFQEQHLNELFLKVCESGGKELGTKDKIKKILLQSQGYSIEIKKNEIGENKTHSIYKKQISKILDNHQFGFEQNSTVKNSKFSRYNLDCTTDLSKEDKVIIGSKNILSACISLFEAAASSKCSIRNNTIYISFNNEAGITRHPYNVLIHLRNAILKAINSGWNVVYLLGLNNNINKAIKFINFAEPLIITGKFNPYYLKKYDTFTIEQEFTVIPEIGALFCLPGKLHLAINSAFYFKNNTAINIFKNHFNVLLTTLSQPLVKYYAFDGTEEYNNCLNKNEEGIGNRFMYKYDFSILSLPENLYARLLQRTNLLKDEILTALEFYKVRLNFFLSNLRHYEYKDIYLTDCIKNLVIHKQLYLYCPGGFQMIDLEVQDIIELLQNIIRLLETYANYNIAFMPLRHNYMSQFVTSYCIVKNRQSVVLEAHKPSNPMTKVRISIEEPMIVKAVEEHFKDMWEQIAPVNKEKKEIISWIQGQIDLLKK